MSTDTILLLVVTIVLSLAVTYYQYYHKAKKRDQWSHFLAFLRFWVFFAIGILLINPKIKKATYQIEKPILSVLFDNSSSIKTIDETGQINQLLSALEKDKRVQEHFEVQTYQFDEELIPFDSLRFDGTKTHLYKLGRYFKTTAGQKKAPLILVTDGNQTDGTNYVDQFRNPTYPIIIGDTTQVEDLALATINVNEYVLERNKFPVEVFALAKAKRNVKAQLQIKNSNKKVVFKQDLEFSSAVSGQQIEAIIPSEKVGVSYYTIELKSDLNEKNLKNNKRSFAIEVINQKTKVAIVSSYHHPDMGMLKRSILTNDLRLVEILKPSELTKPSEYDLVICYQPTAEFQQLFEDTSFKNTNKWIITGKQTDYNFLNREQNDYQFQVAQQPEEYLAEKEAGFNLFESSKVDFNSFPPLENKYLTITPKGKETVLLGSKINSISTQMPLLSFTEEGELRQAYLFGEGIWKWRLAQYRQNENFDEFDLWLDRVIQYLVTEKKKERLKVNHQKLFTTATPVDISAQFYDQTYNLDWNADLEVQFINKETKAKSTFGMTRQEFNYFVSVDNLEPGDYDLIVTEKQSQSVYKSQIKIVETDIESYFVSPNVSALRELAQQTQGAVYLPNQWNGLVQSLLNNPRYKPVEKEIIQTISLIEWKLLLGLIALLLALEWFIRKYTGLL